MQAPEDEPSTSWRPASESFDKINRVMRNAYDGMYQRKIRPFLAPRAEGQGLRPAFDADKENAGVPHVHPVSLRPTTWPNVLM